MGPSYRDPNKSLTRSAECPYAPLTAAVHVSRTRGTHDQRTFRQVAIAATLAAAPATGATFAVNSTADAVDAAPGDGVCETASGNGVCPLRAAIMEANALAGADVVTVPAGTHPVDLFVQFFEPDTEAVGDFDVTDDLDLVGAGAAVTDLYGRGELFDFTVVVPGGDRARVEQLCRYVLRPPLAQERVTTVPDGRVLVTLKTAWHDGTTHLLFEPGELLEKLAALTPRPRVNLVVYHGVLAPHAGWRPRVVAYGAAPADPAAPEAVAPPRRHWRWADLMRRAFEIDVLACPRCGGRMVLIATIDDPAVVRKILAPSVSRLKFRRLAQPGRRRAQPRGLE